jgi:hypothetical protein
VIHNKYHSMLRNGPGTFLAPSVGAPEYTGADTNINTPVKDSLSPLAFNRVDDTVPDFLFAQDIPLSQVTSPTVQLRLLVRSEIKLGSDLPGRQPGRMLAQQLRHLPMNRSGAARHALAFPSPANPRRLRLGYKLRKFDL